MSYDLVIKNGTVVDGTGAKRYQADVAIADGKVAEIGKVTEGAKRTIDAHGLVVTPGFAADCLETLEEIAVENRDIFRAAGGQNFAAIPCLNDSERGMRLLLHLVRRELQGWV